MAFSIQTVFSDDFESDTLSSYEIISGSTWSVGSGKLHFDNPGSPGRVVLRKSISMPTGRDYNISFVNRHAYGLNNEVSEFFFLTDGASIASINGYSWSCGYHTDLGYPNSEPALLSKWVNGTRTVLLEVNNEYGCGQDSDSSILIMYRKNGDMNVFLNGTNLGFSNDTNFTSGSYFLFSALNDTGAQYSWDNLLITNDLAPAIPPTTGYDPIHRIAEFGSMILDLLALLLLTFLRLLPAILIFSIFYFHFNVQQIKTMK